MRIRSEHIRNEVDDRVGDLPPDERGPRAREKIAAQVLRRYVVSGLASPTVELSGLSLPAPEETIDAGSPATNLPDDDYPFLVEALLKSYTTEGDVVAILFGRSGVGPAVGRALDRDVSVIDPYADRVSPAPSRSGISNPGHSAPSSAIGLLHVCRWRTGTRELAGG